jgi:AcrR family transcriptional regulator
MERRSKRDSALLLTARSRATRQRVLAAARDVTRELGLLGTSSNEIARRADVSWGVIQYHFGSREGILLAMIEEGFDGLLDSLDQFEATPDHSTRARVEYVVDAIWQYCTQSDYMQYMDVLRVLSQDPEWTDEVQSLLRRTEQKLTRRVDRLLDGVTESRERLVAIRGLAFASMRGLALKQSFSRPSSRLNQEGRAERQLLATALALVLEQDPTSAGR